VRYTEIYTSLILCVAWGTGTPKDKEVIAEKFVVYYESIKRELNTRPIYEKRIADAWHRRPHKKNVPFSRTPPCPPGETIFYWTPQIDRSA
jgi:hypothetical protein